MKLVIDGQEFEVDPRGDTALVDGQTYSVRVSRHRDIITVYVNERPYHVQVSPGEAGQDGARKVLVDARYHQVVVKGGPARAARPRRPSAPQRPRPTGERGAIVAPMTGRVVRVNVQPGDEVQEGEVLLVIESMKMENEIRSPVAGKVKEVAVQPGVRVSEGDLLLLMEPAE